MSGCFCTGACRNGGNCPNKPFEVRKNEVDNIVINYLDRQQQKKTEPETFEARIMRMHEHGEYPVHFNDCVAMLKEADQRIAQLTTDLAQCTESAPLELVEMVEELIDKCKGNVTDMGASEALFRAQATIERWKV